MTTQPPQLNSESVHANDRQWDSPPNKQPLGPGLDTHRTWSHVNLWLRHMQATVDGVTYTYIEYSLYVPLLFLWEGRSQERRGHSSAISKGSPRTLTLTEHRSLRNT